MKKEKVEKTKVEKVEKNVKDDEIKKDIENNEEQQKEKRKLITNIIFWLVMLVLFVTWITDFIKTQNNVKPVFTFKENELVFKDGTITEYIGLGYKVVYYNRKSVNLQTQFSPIFISTKGLEEVK